MMLIELPNYPRLGWWICILLVSLGVGHTPQLLADELGEEKTVAWLENYADALRQARLTQRPIVLEFRCAP